MKHRCPFIDIHDLATIKEYQSYVGAKYIDADGNEATVNGGQATHPNNLGFTKIAERVISTLFE